MTRRPGERIFGIETEFGCLVDDDDLRPEQIVELIKDTVFYDFKLGVVDLHARDEVFEPAESGGFLTNGGRLYIDAVGSHLEYATAECRTLADLVANDRAGQRVIVRAIRELGMSDKVSVYNNSVDHFGGHTFGCHENYLVAMSDDFFNRQVEALYSFLVTRQIYAGVGRVGGHFLSAGGRPNYEDMMENPVDYIWVSQVYNVFPDEEVEFQLSQRADHIVRTLASRVRFNRALINPKWEHFYAHEGMHRLHVLFGESNQMEYAYALKVGTTSLVLRLLEEGKLEGTMRIADPLLALRSISRDPDYKWQVVLEDDSIVSAIDVQRELLNLCQEYKGDSDEIRWILSEWEATLDQLEKDPMQLGDRLDWVAKRQIVEAARKEFDVPWGHDSLHSIDLEYHNIDPELSLFHALQEEGQTVRVSKDLQIVDAMTDSPQNTRAKARGRIVKELVSRRGKVPYAIDWSGIAIGRLNYLELTDPFNVYDSVAMPE
ncbi:MAG: proteasome accessory factor PafA2 family protein [Fimbriimonadaceae bacterium]|jgi:proteasome accessory factor A|nr:proteasome accessory factor PafA2 family protein [Fimbriimonadaceae bacterium]